MVPIFYYYSIAFNPKGSFMLFSGNGCCHCLGSQFGIKKALLDRAHTAYEKFGVLHEYTSKDNWSLL